MGKGFSLSLSLSLSLSHCKVLWGILKCSLRKKKLVYGNGWMVTHQKEVWAPQNLYQEKMKF